MLAVREWMRAMRRGRPLFVEIATRRVRNRSRQIVGVGLALFSWGVFSAFSASPERIGSASPTLERDVLADTVFWPGPRPDPTRILGTALTVRPAAPLGLAAFSVPGLFRAALFPTAPGVPPVGSPLREPLDPDHPVQPLPPILARYSDLSVLVRGRTELGGSWSRFEPCSTGVAFTCEPNLLPRLDPEVLLSVRAEGTILDRIEVDVDFDQAREFGPANRVNMLYRGQLGEFVQHLELGDVSFDLPDSRFLTRGVPVGNFGFLAEAKAGPMDLQTVWAQQSGDLNSREFRLTGTGARQGFVQEDTLVLDDADYVSGQFFFLIDPSFITDYPHIDVLDLDPTRAPTTLAPGVQPIQLYRYENEPLASEQVQGFIQADAVAGEGPDEVIESGWFRYLQPGIDYTVHSSGLWVALRTPLRRDEMLAVTYITAQGDTIGDYNPERIYTEGERPRLQLIKGSNSNHQPGRATWDLEMHNFYRVSGSTQVDAASIDLTVSLGELSAGRTFKRAPGGEDVTYLRLFGLDEDTPIDLLDRAGVYQPALESFGTQPPVEGTFLVFPTLAPFARPPPLRSLGLDDQETQVLLGAEANSRIYESEDPFERENGGLYRLTIPFRLRSEGVISVVSLQAFAIRPGSERIFLGDRRLIRGVDYEIDYDIGQVILLEPERLFAAAEEPVLRVTWEQQSLFEVSPTSVAGVNATWEFGSSGSFDVLGLYQREQTILRRPLLGSEPAALLLGGVSGRFQLQAGWLDRFFDRLPGIDQEASTSLTIAGELAGVSPDPNLRGAVYVDDFDATETRFLTTQPADWTRGSRLSFRDGAESILPAILDESNHAPLAWQQNWIVQSASGDSLGIFEGLIARQDIDQAISSAGAETRESVLRLTFGGGNGSAFPATRWSSLTTTLSPTGTDLTKSQFLEFYASRGSEKLTLLIDLGVVGEDSFFLDDEGNSSGFQPETGEPWGLGRLDLEADPREGQIWGTDEDSRGVWGESCLAARGAIYALGDPKANCTRGNGFPDSEDLDEDGILDETERYFRYVVELEPGSPYLERRLAETGTSFRLYRIPLEGPLGINVNGVTESDWRSVKHLRVTVVGPGPDSVTLARMRLVGSRWVPRGTGGVVEGIDGDVDASGRLDVGSVSVITEGTSYSSPPGVLEELDDPQSAVSGLGIEFNEKSISLEYSDLEDGARAEVAQRFPQRPRSFLDYRTMRIWAVAHEGTWGEDRDVFAFLKVGEDRDNFYLWRTRLDPPPGGGSVTPGDWLPERVIDMREWLDLRAEAELRIVVNPPDPNGPPVVVWSADSTYAIVLRDRARAPNLAQVREVSLGVMNSSGEPISGEVWFDELRLSDGVTTAGVAARLDLGLSAPGLLDARLSFAERGPRFQQMGEAPTYEQNRDFSASATLRLDAWLPTGWGIEAPLSISHVRTDRDPFFLFRSDVRAEGLPNLRERGSAITRVGLSLRQSAPAADGLLPTLASGLEARVGWTGSSASSLTVEDEAEGVDVGLSWGHRPERRDVGMVPGRLRGLVSSLLPEFLEERLLGARVRWTPERVGFGSSYASRAGVVRRFDRILELAESGDPTPSRSDREDAQSSADLLFRPLSSLSAEFTFLASRDLLSPEVATRDSLLIPELQRQRRTLGGIDLGWETLRDMGTRLQYTPEIVPGLLNSVTYSSRYRSDRDASFVALRPQAGDTARVLARNVSGERDLATRLSLDPSVFAARFFGDTGADGGNLGWISPLTFDWSSTLNARFDRDPVSPGAGFQFGFVGRNGFRFVSADTASTLGDRTRWSTSGGLRLPSQLDLTARYTRADLVTEDTRSERRIQERTWPDVSMRWGAVPIPGAIERMLLSAAVELGLTRSERAVSSGAGAGQLRFDESERIPARLALEWGGGLRTVYDLRLLTEFGGDPTGATERTEVTHSFQATSTLQPGSRFGGRFGKPVDLSLRYVYDADRYCRAATGGNRCVAFLDRIDRSVDLSISTLLSDFEIGVTAAYVDGQSFVGRFPGSTRFRLDVWGEFVFQAGTFR